MALRKGKFNVYALEDDIQEYFRLRDAAEERGVHAWKFFQDVLGAYKQSNNIGGAA